MAEFYDHIKRLQGQYEWRGVPPHNLLMHVLTSADFRTRLICKARHPTAALLRHLEDLAEDRKRLVMELCDECERQAISRPRPAGGALRRMAAAVVRLIRAPGGSP